MKKTLVLLAMLYITACDNSLYPVKVEAICTHKMSMAIGREGFVTMYNLTWNTAEGVIERSVDYNTYTHTRVGEQYTIVVWKTKAQIRHR